MIVFNLLLDLKITLPGLIDQVGNQFGSQAGGFIREIELEGTVIFKKLEGKVVLPRVGDQRSVDALQAAHVA